MPFRSATFWHFLFKSNVEAGRIQAGICLVTTRRTSEKKAKYCDRKEQQQ